LNSVRTDAAADRLILAIIIAFGLLLRLVTLFASVDIPGDGPTRSMMAYDWARGPYAQWFGVWPPGFMYLTGLFGWVVADPKWSIRVLNMVVGVSTIPAFHGVVKRAFDRPTALFSAALLSVLPLHVGLSASSLTEVTFVFELLAALILLSTAVTAEANWRRSLCFGLALILLTLAEMTRYETWALAPFACAYLFIKDRRLALPVVATAVLVLFPIGWTLSNYFETGNALLGFTEAVRGTDEGAESVSMAVAAAMLARKSFVHFGGVLPVIALWGLVLALARDMKDRLSAEQMVIVGMAAFYWLMLFRFAIERGTSLWDRHLLLGLILLIPFVFRPFRNRIGHRSRPLHALIAASTCLVLLALPLGMKLDSSTQVYVQKVRPAAIIQVVDWMKNSRYREQPFLLTKMDWESTYFHQYFPESYRRSLIVSAWLDEGAFGRFVRTSRPKLLLTQPQDNREWARIEHELGVLIVPDRLVDRVAGIEIYSLE